MYKFTFKVLVLLMSFIHVAGQNTEVKVSSVNKDYPIKPVPFTSVDVTDSFWAPRIRLNHEVTVPHAFKMCESRIKNFKIAAGLENGSFQTSYPFDDSEVYKVIQGASYSLLYFADTVLEDYLDSLISIIAMAQEDDGYIYTIRTIDGDNSHPWIGSDRWVEVDNLSHELYNIGHLLEAAAAHYESTGKTNLLNIAIKAADCVDSTFGWGKIEDYPGHQEIEKGLVQLYRVTGEERYLQLAKFFLDVRGNGEQYCQAHKPVVEQEEAVGHSVRAVYMYAGMADVAAILGETDYITAIEKIWTDMVSRKIYVTGGIGASGGNEGFDKPYNLPNSSAYCETCASIGNVYFNHRMFLLHGNAKYIDVLERTMYNSLLSGISVSGNRFFYPNRLETQGEERSEWFECSCCPSNITRFIPSVPGYIYGVATDTLYVNLFMSNHAKIGFDENDTVDISQNTDYPWDGNIKFTVNLKENKNFTLMLRVPGWARNEPLPYGLYSFMDKEKESGYTLKINGETVTMPEKNGYIVIDRLWNDGDKIDYNLPMPVRKVLANKNIVSDLGRVAIQRGPIVYCAEWADNPDFNVLYQNYDSSMTFNTTFQKDLLNGTEVITTKAGKNESGPAATFIPYHLWCNRGKGPMQVWLSVSPPHIISDSLIVINTSLGDTATTNYVSGWEDIAGVFDLYDPKTSGDKGPAAFGNWRADGGTVGTWNWVQYNLHEKKYISASQIYWWDDNQGITLPDECYLSYYDYELNDFVTIPGTHKKLSDGNIKANTYNKEVFKPVYTDIIRINFIGNSKAQGILEWLIYKPGSETSMSNTESGDDIIKLFPNPFSGSLNILTNLSGETKLEIYNSIGKLLLEDNFTESVKLTFNDLPKEKGYYIVKLINGESVYTQELISR